ncbi:MAG: flagellar basal body L-ring protein FlgH [bacterium]
MKYLILSILALVVLAGCAPTPPKPPANYAMVQPVVPGPATYEQGSIFSATMVNDLYTNRVARRVGDIISVKLEESTNATKSQDTDTKRATGVDITNPTIAGEAARTRNAGIPFFNNSLASSNSFKGESASKQSNQLSGSIAVIVTRVYPNGLLEIRGEKWIGINQGQEYIQLSGLVRQVDVDSSNEISSTKIANAQIAYGGRGTLADANRPGWMSRFFNSVVWPF